MVGRIEVVRTLDTACPQLAREGAARLHVQLLSTWSEIRAMGDSAKGEDVRYIVIQALTVELQNAELARNVQELRATAIGNAAEAERLRNAMERIRFLDEQVENWTAAHAKLDHLRRTAQDESAVLWRNVREREEAMQEAVSKREDAVEAREAAARPGPDQLAALDTILTKAGVDHSSRPPRPSLTSSARNTSTRSSSTPTRTAMSSAI